MLILGHPPADGSPRFRGNTGIDGAADFIITFLPTQSKGSFTAKVSDMPARRVCAELCYHYLPAERAMRPIHNRMPVILPPEKWPLWIGEDTAGLEQLKAALRPYPAEGKTMWPVSTRVGNVKKNDTSLIEPAELATEEKLTV